MQKKYPPINPKFPHMLHGGDYNPDQWYKWKDTIWKEDMRLFNLAGINCASVGIFSWSRLEPEEGVYDFSWLDEVMDMLAANGMYAILATPSGARPAWMDNKYPEVMRVTGDRHRRLHGERHNHCLSSPIFREKVTEMNSRLAERYKDHPALMMWHLSNEYAGECHCPLCQEKFREWLKKRYGTLDALNTAWWTAFWSHTFTDWSQIESPSVLGDTTLHGLNLDWQRFTTDQYIDFIEHEKAPLRKYTPNIPVTTNLMTPVTDVNYFDLAKVLDVVSWDNYPTWKNTCEDADMGARIGFHHDVIRGVARNKPFMLMESSPSSTNWQPVAKLRRPGGHKLYSLQAVAHGSDTVQYFQLRKSRGSSEKFHGAVIDHVGTEETRVFKEVADLGANLKKLDDIVGTYVDAKVALVYDWENRWALENAQYFINANKKYYETVIEHYASFYRKGVSVSIIDSTCPLDDYDLVVAPMLYMLRGDMAQKITSFVENGGSFVASYVTGYVDDTDLCFLGGFPGPLKDVLGIWNEEIDALYPDDSNTVTYGGKEYKAFDLCEILHLKGAKALGEYKEDFYAGCPAVTVNEYGKGKAYYIAARTGGDLLDALYGDIIADCGIKPVLCGTPNGVYATCRTDGEKEYVFLMNYMPTCQQVEVGQGGVSLLSGEKVEGTVTIPARGVDIFVR